MERKWEKIANLNEGVINPIIVTMDDKYIFKYGGINKFGYIDKTIERYNSMTSNYKYIKFIKYIKKFYII